MRLLILFLSILLLALPSCKKPEDRACWKSAGDEDSAVVVLPNFSKLRITEHLICILVPDTVNKMVVRGGKNLLSFISAEVVDGFLEIKNENKCSFLRSYDKKVTVEIHLNQLEALEFEGTEPLTCSDTLHVDWFTLLIRDGAGPVTLWLNAQQISATLTHGYGDFTLCGVTNTANFNVRSNGYCNTYGLSVLQSIVAISRTQGDLRIRANGCSLSAQTENDGNIYYKGLPSSISFNKYGGGELINDN
jgi:hypothetical protein